MCRFWTILKKPDWYSCKLILPSNATVNGLWCSVPCCSRKFLRSSSKPTAGYLISLRHFINPIEVELNQPFARMAGRSHGLQHHWSYFKRIAAINYVLAHDDGVNPKNFADADIILIGVSRSGKTPTCLYLGLQYGIAAANYPLTEEDMPALQLPKVLENVRSKLFGLTLSAAQLHFIRQERRPNSQYASLVQCQQEIQWQESLFRQFNIPYLDTTRISIEEISAIILNRCGLKRQLYG
jgi:regulator of PEP synthase PpsR (kinase-PPPase family)